MMANSIALPDAPAVPGLLFRPVRGEADVDALHAVHAGRAARDRVDPFAIYEDAPGREQLRASLSQALAAGRRDWWLVAQVGDQVAGYGKLDCWPEDDGTWVYLVRGWVLPGWRGRGLGTALLHWAEERARVLAAADHPGEKWELAANASSTEEDTTALLLHEGYRAGYTVLEMDLEPAAEVPLHPLPAGIDVRPALPEHYLLIAESLGAAYHQEYEDGRYQETYDPAAYAAGLRAPKHDPALWQVAWEGDQVVGQVLCLLHPNHGEVFEVSVRPAWRRRGLARALLSRALHGLRARGIQPIRIRTVYEFRTRARDLYGSVGFRVVKQFPRYRKPAAWSPWG